MIILLSVTFILFILVHQFWWRRQGYPNGPLPLPIVGNIHQFAFHKRWEDKFVEFKEQYGSVYTLFLGPIPVITINDYDTCVQLFAKEGDIYSNRPTLQHFNQITRNGTYGLGQTNGQQWLEQRRAVLRILKDFGLGKNQMQERILDEIHTICDNLNNELKKGVVEHNINQYTDIAIGSVINSLICGYRFTTNNKASEFEHLKHWSDRFTHLITDPITSMGIYSERLSRWPLIRNKITDLREVFDELFSFVDRAIEEHKAHNDYEHTEFHPHDLIDAYMQQMWKSRRTGIGEHYSEVQCRNIILDLWLAGQETTSTLTQWFFAFVILNQDKQAKIHDELNRVIGSDRTISMSDRFNLPYLNAAINEAQRCSALPVFNVPHALAKDANLNGYNLKKETIIFPQISTIMKDPANFPSPNNFYPERFIDSNGQLFNTEKVVSFSIGKRSCPGEGLARMELFLLTANLLNQYKFLPTKEPPSLDRCISGGIAICKQFSLKFYVLFLLVCVIFHKTKAAELKKAEDVFEPGLNFLQKNLELCLDDFARKDAVIEVLELKDLSLCVSAPSRFPRHWLGWYYKKSVENLQKAAPNLKSLELNGGYVYNPKDCNGIGELKSEISYLHAYLNAIALAMEQKFRLKVNILNVLFVFSENVKNSSDYKQLLLNKFGEASILDETDSNGVEMLIEAGKHTEIRLNLAFLTNLELIKKVGLPKGRTQFRHAAEKYLRPLWKQMAEEAKIKALEPFKSLVPPGIRWISNPRQIRLEEFHQDGFLQEQKELEQITVGFSTPPDYLDISVQDFYKHSVENLRATFANLKRLRFEGGYVYKPEDESETFRVLTDEIVYLQNLTGALIKAVKTTSDDKQKLELLQLDLRTVWFYTTNKDFNLKKHINKFKDTLISALHPDLIIEDPIKDGELYIESKIGETKSLQKVQPHLHLTCKELRKMKLLALLFLVPLVFAEDVFEADDKILKNAENAQIEQFISTKNLTLVDNTDEITFNALLYTPTETENPEAFYEKAVENLKKYAPKSRILHLFGGHTFYPETSTPKAIQEEIASTKYNLKFLIRALNKNKITVSSNLLTIMIVADDKSQKESKFEEIVAKQFGEDSVIDDSNEDGLELLFKMEGVDIHLYLVFINNLDAVKKTKFPYGHTAYGKSVTDYLDPIYDELEEQSKKRIKSDDTKLFVPGVKRLNKAGELHLEEFYDKKFVNPQLNDTTPQETLEQLVLSVGVPQLINQTSEEFYSKAVQNLKAYAPNLKNVRFDGGYSYNPKKTNNNTIKDEIIFFHDNLDAVLKAFKDEGITVSSLKLKVYWASSKKDAEDSGYPALLKEAFGYEPSEADVDSGKVLMVFKLQGIPASVDLHFFDKAPKELPFGRTNYYTASKLREDAEEKEDSKESKSSEETKS